MSDKSYYAILGVRSDASGAAIKQAYKRLARQCHPDLHPGDPHAEARFKEVSHAASVLSDPAQRATYDRTVGLAFGAPNLTIAQWEAYGYEATADLALTLAEASAGTTKVLTFHTPDGRPYQLSIQVPPGAYPGQRLRLPKAGGPARAGAERGDLIVIVRITAQLDRSGFFSSNSPSAGVRRRPFTLALLVCVLVTAAIIMGFLLHQTPAN